MAGVANMALLLPTTWMVQNCSEPMRQRMFSGRRGWLRSLESFTDSWVIIWRCCSTRMRFAPRDSGW